MKIDKFISASLLVLFADQAHAGTFWILRTEERSTLSYDEAYKALHPVTNFPYGSPIYVHIKDNGENVDLSAFDSFAVSVDASIASLMPNRELLQ